MTDQILPHNLEAERAVITLVLADSDSYMLIADYLLSADFYDSANAEVWQAIGSLYNQGQGIDITSIRTELKKQQIDPKPAIEAVARCYQDTPVISGNLMNFAKEVKNKSMLRSIVNITNQYNYGSRVDDAKAETILSSLEKELIEVADKLKDDRPNDAKGILNEINIDIAKGEASGWKGMDTGFSSIDKITGGLLPTHCWIVGAYTGTGKTFFILQMLLNVLGQGGKVILFSTEMDRKMNMLRLVANLAGIGTIRILKGELDEDEKNRLFEAQKKLSGYKDTLTIYDNVYTVEEMRLKAKKKKLKDGLDVIFVDFIQNLRGAENIYERMSNAAITLQQLAQELGVTVVIASQVSQAAAGWSSKEAIEYKGAGEIAAVADVGIWIKKDKTDRSAREVILRKVRHGKSDCFTMVRLSFPSGRIIEMGIEGEDGNRVSTGDNEDVKNQL